MNPIKVQLPLTAETIRSLKAGDQVRLSGILYTGRDAAHQRLIETLEQGLPLPFDLRDQVIYYVGPAPAKPGQVVGPAGPTSSYRMDAFTPRLLDLGLRGMIGKGNRSPEVIDAMIRNQAVYFAAIGGLAVLISRSIVESEIIAYPELGTEALCRLKVVDFPAIVAIDATGRNLYVSERAKYRG